MSNALGNLALQSATVANAPGNPTDVVRLGDLTSGLATKAASSHTHPSTDITGFTLASRQALVGALKDSGTVAWTIGQSGTQSAGVILNPVGGIVEGTDGLEIQLSGTGAIASQAYVDAHTHAAATGSGTGSVALSVNPSTQVIVADLVIDGVGAVEVGPSGLRVIFGTSANTVPRGNHNHDGVYQVPLIASNTGHTVVFTQSGTGNAYLSADVRLDPSLGSGSIPLRSTSQGLSIPVGQSGTQVALGNHTHAVATQSAAGMMSAADKTKLDGMTAIPLPFPFYQASPLVLGHFLPGFLKRPTASTLSRLDVMLDAPLGGSLTFEAWAGSSLSTLSGTGTMLTIPLGQSGTQSMGGADVALALSSGSLLRFKIVAGVSGPGDSGNCTLLAIAV